ncbi:SCO2322 family protein [Streptomyces fradiae]|uniref:SCO2322 family protein n=1 Tax=Streptomyces fradiae TaxID=1906 RepID=UPI00369BFC30
MAVLAGVPAAAGTAHAAGYRYWSFWEGGDGKSATWAYATQGPATLRPADGAVNGYRFAVSTDSADADRPRHAPDFAAICAGTPAAPGTKRIALVVDFGVPADAPAGEAPPGPRTACARVAPDATAAEALAAVAAPLRYNSQALLCGISGYPRQGCGEQVDTAARPSSPPDPASSAPGATAGAGTTAGSGTTAGPDITAGPGAKAGPDSAAASGGQGPSLGLYAGAAAVVALGAAALVRARRHGRR